jgi:hypothetical protein
MVDIQHYPRVVLATLENIRLVKTSDGRMPVFPFP